MDAGPGSFAELQRPPGTAFERLAADADLLLCEAGIDRHDGPGPQVHLIPEDAGRLARTAGVERLLVTRAGPAHGREAAARRAAGAFGGPTAAAYEARPPPRPPAAPPSEPRGHPTGRTGKGRRPYAPPPGGSASAECPARRRPAARGGRRGAGGAGWAVSGGARRTPGAS